MASVYLLLRLKCSEVRELNNWNGNGNIYLKEKNGRYCTMYTDINNVNSLISMALLLKMEAGEEIISCPNPISSKFL